MFTKKHLFTFASIFSLVLYGIFIVSAAAPSGGYSPGATLDPDCAPGDMDCIVQFSGGATPTNGLSTIGGGIGLGGTLTEETTIELGENHFLLAQDNFLLHLSIDNWSGFGIPGAGFSFIDTYEQSGITLVQSGDNGETYPSLFYYFDDGYDTATRELLLGDRGVFLTNNENSGDLMTSYAAAIDLVSNGVYIDYSSSDPTYIASSFEMTQYGTSLHAVLLPNTESTLKIGDHFSGVINGALLLHENTADSDSAFLYAADVAGNTQTGMTYLTPTGQAHSVSMASYGATISYQDFTDINTDRQLTIDVDGFRYNFNSDDLVTGYYQFPNSQGTIDYVLRTDGAGTLTWEDPVLLASDERLKSNIIDLDNGILDTLLDVRTISYTMDLDPNQKTKIGFIAQDLQQYFPELVDSRSDGYLGVAYAQMTPILTKAIQELNLKITNLENLTLGSTEPTAIFGVLRTWFADATNGIEEFIAGTVRARNQICIDDVCMTKDQLRNLLENNPNSVYSSGSSNNSTPDDDTNTSESESETIPDEIQESSDPEILSDESPETALESNELTQESESESPPEPEPSILEPSELSEPQE